jgi:phenylacetic acid degradation operon negative regulatory protein
MNAKPSPRIATLITAFGRRKPVRAGSLIITLYGDAIVPRGGSLSLGDISAIMALFKIDNGHVRTAISRLTSEQWLERRKVGRNTFYRLSKQGEGEFARATSRIYFSNSAQTPKEMRLALLDSDAADRTSLRKKLEAAGYAPFNALTYVSVRAGELPEKSSKGLRILNVPLDEEAAEVLRVVFKLEELAERYDDFIKHFAPLRGALKKGTRLDDSEALIVRLLLIQEFRRVVLRDPPLPQGVVPNWPGEAARRLAAEIYRQVLPGSERYLDACQADEKRALPKPNSQLSQRFAAAR